MEPIVIRHELDPTGTSPNNYVDDEPHALLNRNVRALIPTYGAYFTESLVITDVATGLPLTKGVQYFPAEYYPLPSGMYGKEICGLVVITDTAVSPNVKISYQAVGSYYGTSVEAIIQQLDKMNLDNRPIKWADIINKPDRFNPAHHWHDAGDVIGFEFVVYAIDRLSAAIELGDAASHDAIYMYMDKIEAMLMVELSQLDSTIQDHKNNTSNPHGTTASQVGAFTKGEVHALLNGISDNLNAHVARTDNPHNTHAHQVGTYTSLEIDNAINAAKGTLVTQLNAHLNDKLNPHNTTAEQVGTYTKLVIDSKDTVIRDAMNAHIARTDNPHGVDKTDVGLSNVANYGPGSKDNIANALTDKFATASAVKAYIDDRLATTIYAPLNTWVPGAAHIGAYGYCYMHNGSQWCRTWPPDLSASLGEFNALWDIRLEARFDFYL